MNIMDIAIAMALNKTSGGVTEEEMNKAINEAIAKIDNLSRKIVNSVSDIDITASDADKYIYMVLRSKAEENNIYDEYMVINAKLELVGNTQIDLSGYVKNTDYATNSKLGLVKINHAYGIGIRPNQEPDSNVLYMLTATGSDIDQRKNVTAAITPNMLDYAIRVGLTTNKGELTDDEKIAAKNFLGVTEPDLSAYVQRTVDNRATSTKLGVVITSPTYGITTNTSGCLIGSPRTIDQVASNTGTMILNIGTARNCAEEWTFTLADGTTVTKNVFVIPPKE